LISADTVPDTNGSVAPVQSGPASVSAQISEDSIAKGMFSLLPAVTTRYFNVKKSLQDDYGFGFGFDYNALYQSATNSPGGDKAAGGVFRAYGEWKAIETDPGNSGSFIYKIENRHALGTDIPPAQLGSEVGYAGMTAVTFSNYGWALTNLYWVQHLLDNRVGFTAGIVDTTDYVDVYGLSNIWTAFSNDAFATDPTIPAPGQGLGMAVRFMATDNLYILGGIADANGDPTASSDAVSSFFNDAEYFSHIELGWAFSWQRRMSDNIHLTAWHADAREKARTSEGWGAAFSFCRLFDNTWEPFLRAGFSDGGGAMWERSVSAGTAYNLSGSSSVLGLGLNWSRPSTEVYGAGLDDQYTAELYYRFQLLKVLSITPDLQLLVNPATNPDHDTVAVFGLRGRINF